MNRGRNTAICAPRVSANANVPTLPSGGQAEIKTQLLHEELALFSRIATFSELMAWLAHELHQPLTAILSNAQAALRVMDRGAPDLKEFREIFNDIVAEEQRASEMIRGMRSNLKQGVSEHKSHLLNDVIKEIMPIVQNDSRVGYVLKVDAGSELLPAVMAVFRGEQYISSSVRR